MAQVGKVVELWRYPVSSMAGELCQTLELTPEGVHGERQLGLVDRATGEIADFLRDRRFEKVVFLSSRLEADGSVQIRLPDGDWIDAPSETASKALTDFMGFPVEIRPYRDAPGFGWYAGPYAVNRYRPSALHLLTTASMARLKALHPEGNPDRRRFRPNVVVEMAEVEGVFPESQWLDREIMLGAIPMTISAPTRRCGFTVVEQQGLASDPNILRHLVRNNQHNMGVYCSLETSGTITIGDAMALV